MKFETEIGFISFNLISIYATLRNIVSKFYYIYSITLPSCLFVFFICYLWYSKFLSKRYYVNFNFIFKVFEEIILLLLYNKSDISIFWNSYVLWLFKFVIFVERLLSLTLYYWRDSNTIINVFLNLYLL